jgi:hypothetical protein
MNVKLFLVRKDKKLHSLIWVCDAEEAAELDRKKGTLLDDSEGIAKLNAFLSAKDPFALIASIASFGSPLSHRELTLDASFGMEKSKLRRTYAPEEFLKDRTLKRFSNGSRAMLASECWFLVAGSAELSQEKESAARRAVSEFGFGEEKDLRAAVESCKSGGLVVVEPLQDWVWLKNMLVLMLSLGHSLESGCPAPLLDCGFRKTSVTKFGVAEAFDSTYTAFVIPVAFNEYWRNEKLSQLLEEAIDFYNPFRGEGFLSWAPYSKIGFESINDSRHRVTQLKDASKETGRSIRYVSVNQIDGKPGSLRSFRKDWGGNLYLAITGDIDNERSTAEYFFDAMAKSRMEYGWIDYDFAVDADRDGGLVARTLESQIWLTLLGRGGVYIGICERCGLPYLVKGRTRKRFCSHNCLQMAKKESC